MTTALATLILAAIGQQPVPLHVYVTTSRGPERPPIDTKDSGKWNTVRNEGVQVHLSKELDELATPRARKVLAEAVKGFPAGTLVGAGFSDPRTVESLREVLLRSPFAAGLAGKVGKARNPKALIGPAATFEVEVSDAKFNLRTSPPIEDPKLAMADEDLAPDPRAEALAATWSPPRSDVADQRIELHFEGPFYGQARFRAASLATKVLAERMADLEEEFLRRLREDVESSYGSTGWSGKTSLTTAELPDVLARQLEGEARSRYEQLGFRTADEAWAAVRNGKLRVKSLSFVVMVQVGNHVQYFPLDTGL